MTEKLAQEYQISEATIFADRLEDERNITNYIGELSFFEDLERPYVTAQVVCMDDIGLFSELKIQGTEQMRFTVESVESSVGNLSFTIVLNIVSIIQTNKAGDRSELYHINLISPHAYRDANTKISRSYTGKLELTAEAILKNHLDVDVDISYTGGELSIQPPAKVLIPYLSPLESVEWLFERATTKIGAPFYAWQTIYDQKEGKDTIRFGSLEYMMNAPTYNEQLPLSYSAAAANSVAQKDISYQAVAVKKLVAENIQDTLKMVHEGSIGSELHSIDTYTSQEFARHYSIKDQITSMEKSGIIPYGADQNVYDEEHKITSLGERKSLHELNSRQFSTITSYGTYGYVNSYHDAIDPTEALNKVRSFAIKSMFDKNTIDIVIPGISFFAQLGNGNSGVSVGDTVMINFLNSDVDEDVGGAYNEELSGKYLIHRCRNVFVNTKHEIVVSVSKVASSGLPVV